MTIHVQSPVERLGHYLYKRVPIPFDWIVEYAGDSTIADAWRAEADAIEPSPASMLSILLQLRLLHPRKRDTRLRDGFAALLMGRATYEMSPAYAEALAPWVKAAFVRHPTDWYLTAIQGVYCKMQVVDGDLRAALEFLSATPAELRANGSGRIFTLAAPPFTPAWHKPPPRRTANYARAIAEAVPAPSMTEIFALLEARR